ncbi:TetR/AcrR family transcriptional regulator [Paenibacillus sp. BC26]|uniref:TetR/AcrR family transcriptional regulator n=1 Tax=Paenibacillus sp. BC26 TaxID=1881032 RepID=UPI0008E4563B|nr:TetR/AcrR family transcriptional regulator [Paenibacillus sp. BC26]SFS55731.1 transcriptional regulator, TetR family [Paenibacillus sp. BC26]
MSLLRDKIIGSAMRIFAQKGFAATSIQDIANDCGIAKGSLYKFFASKEDLLVEVYRHRIQLMFDQVDRIKADATLSPKARFVQETLNQFISFKEFKSSIKDFYELKINDTGVFATFVQQIRSQMFVYLEESLVHAYGPVIDKYKWDLIALYIGIIKEYMVMTELISSPFDYEQMAAFVVDRMDEMVAGLLQSKSAPILESSVMTQFVACGMKGTAVPAEEQLGEGLNRLLSTIQELQATNARKTELNDAAILLQEEADADKPRMVLVRALIGLLHSQHELTAILGQLEKLFELKAAS